ncbi:hypothetical protein [Paenibacillus sp. GCM10027626]|uniref:hypothetical protein n=1 Tax=Paenibacillus sp. GCM10027626 TaxID=3273411 RepID=UPI00363A671F
MLTLGTATRVINPSLRIPLAGWGAQNHIVGTALEADFRTTVFAIAADDTVAVIIDVDTSHFSKSQADEFIREIAGFLELDESCIRLSTTHTHSGPLLSAEYYPEYEPEVRKYAEDLLQKTKEAAREALDNRIKVTVGAGTGSCDVAVNRRQHLPDGRTVTGANAHGVTDSAVGVIRFDDERGNVAAAIVHYSCHPTVLGYENTLYSPEYPGVVKRMLEHTVGGTCLFLQGAAGNVGPGYEGFGTNLEEMKRIGKIIGCEAAKTVLETSTTPVTRHFAGVVESGAPLGIWKLRKETAPVPVFQIVNRSIKLPLKEQLTVEEAVRIANGCRDQLWQLRAEKAPEQLIKEATFKAKRAFMAVERSEMYHGKRMIEVNVQFIRIGDIVMIGSPIEPFVQIGLDIKKRSPFPFTFYSGYTNGTLGYMPTREDYPFHGYEVDTTPYSPDAAEPLIDEIVNELISIWKGGGEI